MPVEKNQTVTLIVAASARALAQSAVASTYKVAAADLFADFDLRKTCSTTQILNYPAGFVSVVKKIQPEYVVYTGGLENYPEVIAEIEESAVVLGNSSSVLTRLLDKFAIFELLKQNGFLVPQSSSVLSAVGNRTWLLKRIKSSGGLDIKVAGTDRRKQSSLKHGSLKHDTTKEFYFQEQVFGESWSAAFLATKDGRLDTSQNGLTKVRLLGTTVQLTGDPRFNASGFLYTGSIVSRLSPENEAHLIAMAQLLATEFDLIGLFNIDFIKRNDEIYFIEINPRYSASMELFERSSGISFFDLHVTACGGEFDLDSSDLTENLPSDSESSEPKSSAHLETIHGKAIYYSDQKNTVTQKFPELAIQEVDENGFAQIADIPTPGTTIEKSQPAFTVFATGPSQAVVDEKLMEAATMFGSRLAKVQ